MKIMVDNGLTRQMQPKDQKFLSDACLELVRAFGDAILAIFGYADGDAVVLSGLSLNITNAPVYTIKEGIVYWNKNLYYIPASTVTSNNYAELLSTLVVSLPTNPILVAPSPVRDENLDLTVNVHYDYRGSSGVLAPTENMFAFDAGNIVYPTIKRLGELQRKIIASGD